MKLDKDILIERRSLKSRFPADLPAVELTSADVISHWRFVKSVFYESVDGRVIDECSKRFRNTFK